MNTDADCVGSRMKGELSDSALFSFMHSGHDAPIEDCIQKMTRPKEAFVPRYMHSKPCMIGRHMPTTKLNEAEARILALQIAATFPGHEATTAQIKDLVPKYRKMSPDDDKIASRSPEPVWRQIMGNATASHQTSPSSIFNLGHAVRTDDGIRVTEEGLDFLRSEGLYP